VIRRSAGHADNARDRVAAEHADTEQACAVVPGSVLGHRYRLDERIAVGGMGEVWRCTDLGLERVVAIKLLRPEYAGRGVPGQVPG
jgi:serine/threonine protein kinase